MYQDKEERPLIVHLSGRVRTAHIALINRQTEACSASLFDVHNLS